MFKLRWILMIAINIIIPCLADAAPAQSPSFRNTPGNAMSTSISHCHSGSITAQRDGGCLHDCMASWDAATHMTKQEWRAACIRTINVDPPRWTR
jgi:hypothetical protein